MAETETDVAETDAEGADAGDFKKNDLINLVVEESGMKKKDVKPVVEATLAVLGRTLSEGRNMNLPPFGKAKITRTNDQANATVTTLRIRQSTTSQEAPDPLETAAEDG